MTGAPTWVLGNSTFGTLQPDSEDCAPQSDEGCNHQVVMVGRHVTQTPLHSVIEGSEVPFWIKVLSFGFVGSATFQPDSWDCAPQRDERCNHQVVTVCGHVTQMPLNGGIEASEIPFW